MNMFVVLALAAFAAAEPEADPQLLLGGINGVHSSYTPYSHVAPVSTYASPLWKNIVPAVKSVIPAVKYAVKPVVPEAVVSSYSHGLQYPITSYGAQYPMTYGANYPMTYGANYPVTYGANYPITYGVHGIHKREAEADPALIYSGFPYSGLTHTAVKTPLVSSYSHGIQYPMTYGSQYPFTYGNQYVKSVVPAVNYAVKPVVPEVKPVVSTPVVSSYTHGLQYPITSYGAQYPITSYRAQYPMTYGVVAEPTKVVTNYINSEHYTAEATPLGKALGVPSYTAKNGEVVHEVQKREAEADPALIYSGFPYTGLTHTAVKTPLVSSYRHGIQYPMTYGSQYPLTYGKQYVVPAVQSVVPAVKSVVSDVKPVLSTPVISSYIHTPYTQVVPAVKPVVSTYGGLTHTPVYKTQDHGVVATYAGLVHSSHAGLCFNNEGVQVAC